MNSHLIIGFVLALSLPAFGEDGLTLEDIDPTKDLEAPEQAADINPKANWVSGLAPASGSFTLQVRNKSVFSSGYNAHDDPSMVADLFIKLKCGLTLDIWGTMPTDTSDFNEDFGTEVDYSLGWSKKVKGYLLTFGVAWYDLKQVGDIEGSDFFNFSFEISRDYKVSQELMLTPFFRVEMNVSPDGSAGHDLSPRLGVKYGLDLPGDFALGGRVFLQYDPGTFGFDTAYIGNYEVGLTWKIHEHVILEIITAKLIHVMTDVNDGRDEVNKVFTSGVTFTW